MRGPSSASLSMPPLPIASRPASNCGLTRKMPAGARRGEIERRRQRQLQRDEADVADQQVRRAVRRDRLERKVAGVQPFDAGDAGIGPARPRSIWPWPTSMAVTWAAPRSSSTCVKPPVEAPMSSALAAGRIEAEMVEPGDQLQRRARHVACRPDRRSATCARRQKPPGRLARRPRRRPSRRRARSRRGRASGWHRGRGRRAIRQASTRSGSGWLSSAFIGESPARTQANSEGDDAGMLRSMRAAQAFTASAESQAARRRCRSRR